MINNTKFITLAICITIIIMFTITIYQLDIGRKDDLISSNIECNSTHLWNKEYLVANRDGTCNLMEVR